VQQWRGKLRLLWEMKNSSIKSGKFLFLYFEEESEMPDLKITKSKHLTMDDRQEIMECLDKGMSFKSIARRIGKASTTVSREVKKHLSIQPLAVKRTKLDGTPIDDRPCPLLLKAPFVCNPCKKRRTICTFQKQLYLAKNAQTEYETLLSEAREGIPLNKEEFWESDAIIAAGIKKGQRLYHIMESNTIAFSKSSAYRYLHKDYLSICKLDLPRVVKFKARKQRRPDSVPKTAREGRTYADFLAFVDEQGINTWVEMDTVIGRIGGKVIMTFNFTFCNFMFGLLLDDKTAAEAALKIRTLKKTMHQNGVRFGDVLPILLTDNGGEFSNVTAFIADINGELETSLFFCDPCQSYQKPRVEKNHTLFRDIVPKGNSFDDFNQETVNLIFSHVNSVKRKILNGKTPYELFCCMFDKEIASLLGVEEVPKDQVVQSPKLLKTSTP
jgi:IS30 family transposase